MAADAVPLTISGGGAAGPEILSGRSPARGSPSATPAPASSRPASAADAAGGDGSAGGNSSASHQGQSSSGPAADGSSGANGSGAANSGNAPGSNSSGNARPGQSGNSKGAPPPAGRSARASGASPASSPETTPQAGISSDDFSATLAQSLAAAPDAQTAPTGTATAKGSAKTGTDEPGDASAKHSDTDPVSSALALLENALSGVLAGVMASVPTASATSAGGAPSPDSRIGAGDRTASALETLLARNLASAPNAAAAGSAPKGAPPTTAGPAATATAAAAALTAAQLTSGSVGQQHVRPDPATMAVSAPVGSSGWTEELGAKVTWMAHQGIESASLQLSPEHLGPLQVTISVHDGQASVWFGAAQPDTRTALQQSLPQLRQLFASQGLALADAGVSRESPRGQDRQRPGRAGAPVAGVTAVGPDTTGRVAVVGGLGLVDTYA